MRIVVAGAAGFIGQRAARALTAAGHLVVRLNRGDEPRELAGADVLVWAAGKREPTLEDNRAIHVRAPLEAQRAIGAAKVVYLSTGEVYGDAPLPYREDGPVRSSSAYAIAKREGEAALGAIATVLRIGVAYGPSQRSSMLIPSVVTALRAGQHVALTHGQQTRDLVFVDDIAHAIVRAVAAPPLGIINIASGVETPIRTVCEAIADALGADRGLLGFGEKALRPDEATRYVLDVTRAREHLGWTATTSLAAGFAQL